MLNVLVGRISDRGEFAGEPPVEYAILMEWTEPHHAGAPVHCRAWGIEIDSLEDLIHLLNLWSIDDASSVEVSMRGPDLVAVLLDYDFEPNELLEPCVVDVVGVMGTD